MSNSTKIADKLIASSLRNPAMIRPRVDRPEPPHVMPIAAYKERFGAKGGGGK